MTLKSFRTPKLRPAREALKRQVAAAKDIRVPGGSGCITSSLIITMNACKALDFACHDTSVTRFYKDDPEEMKNAMHRHSEFFNTENATGSAVIGLVAPWKNRKTWRGS